jgi:hypothetical protein
VYAASGANFPETGIQLLTGNPQYYAIDNDQTLAGNPFGIYDGFTDAEKFSSVSSGLSKIQAGNPTSGNDVSHVVGSGPFNIAAGQTITVAFALHAASSHTRLINSARYADTLYNYTLKAPMPLAPSVEVCSSEPASLVATGATAYKWYRDRFGGQPVLEGATISLPSIDNDTTLYVSNAEHTYESSRTAVAVNVMPTPEIELEGPAAFCEGGSVILSSNTAGDLTWSNGAKTTFIEISEPGVYTVSARNGTVTCSSADAIMVNVFPSPSAAFIVSPEIPVAGQPANFSATSDASVSWMWDFGDGTQSSSRNAVHTYDQLGDYTVTLTVTSAHNCSDTESVSVGNVTAVEPAGRAFVVYPNPLQTEILFLDIPIPQRTVEVTLTDSHGRAVMHKIMDAGEGRLNLHSVSNGVYILHVNAGKINLQRKIIVAR